jgi:hypothetical protein
MKNSLLATAVFVLFAGSAYSVTLANSLLVNNMIIHLSGSGTETPPGLKTDNTKKAPPHITPVFSERKPAVKSGGSHAVESKPSGTKEKKRRAARPSPGPEKEPGRTETVRVRVVNADGRPFVVDYMKHGMDDMLRVDTGREKMSLRIDSISLLQFGKQTLNRLDVSVRLVNGGVIHGYIYPQTVLEFITDDSTIIAYANQLRSVNFQRE